MKFLSLIFYGLNFCNFSLCNLHKNPAIIHTSTISIKDENKKKDFNAFMNDIFLYLFSSLGITFLLSIAWQKLIAKIIYHIVIYNPLISPSISIIVIIIFFIKLIIDIIVLHSLKNNAQKGNYKNVKYLFYCFVILMSMDVALFAIGFKLGEILGAIYGTSILFLIMFYRGKNSNMSYDNYHTYIKNIGLSMIGLLIFDFILYIFGFYISILNIIISLLSIIMSSISINYTASNIQEAYISLSRMNISHEEMNKNMNILKITCMLSFYHNFLIIFKRLLYIIYLMKKK